MFKYPPIFYRDAQLPFVEVREIMGGRACYDRHSHDTFSTGIIISGQAKCWTARKSESTERGSVVQFNPQETHACNPQYEAEWGYKMLYVQPS